MALPATASMLVSRARLTAQQISRDKADTLLLMTACVLVLAPHVMHVPPWAAATCGFALLWRGWITITGRQLPARWLLLPVCLLAMVGVYISHSTLLGRDAGVTMLVLLVAFKMLEMHARRDLFVVILLCFFLMLTNFFYSQSIGTGLMMAAAVVTLVTAQLSFQFTGVVPPLKQRLRMGLSICLMALPLMLVLFLLFPRIPGPLWSLPGDASGGRTGLSESMSPGNISSLAMSDEPAFRVRFIDPPPIQEKRYWRGVVLGRFDGRTWTPVPMPMRSRPVPMEFLGEPIRHEITLEPNNQHWLFALEAPVEPPALQNNRAYLRADLQMVARAPVHERLRYEVASVLDFQVDKAADPQQLQDWLELPAGYNPKTHLFAETLRGEPGSDLDKVNRVLAYFRKENFSYTLEPPLLGKHGVDEFLFSSRAGFCEHYASAFVVLMRALDIPARVVTGYQGGEINPVDGIMTVSQSDAHAWAEVWLRGRGWVRVDPTSAVAPQRISRSLSSVVGKRAFGGLVDLEAVKDSWVGRLNYRISALGWAWNQWVLNYTQDKQKSLLRSFGFTQPDWRTLAMLLFSVSAVVLAAMVLPLLLQRRKIDPLDALYGQLCRIMARHGLTRLPHEGPRSYAERIAAAGLPGVTSDRREAALRFLHLYEHLRYAATAAQPAVATPGLRHLKTLLKHCR